MFVWLEASALFRYVGNHERNTSRKCFSRRWADASRILPIEEGLSRN